LVSNELLLIVGIPDEAIADILHLESDLSFNSIVIQFTYRPTVAINNSWDMLLYEIVFIHESASKGTLANCCLS